MANSLRGQRISETFQNLVQYINGIFYDGAGNVITSGNFSGSTGPQGPQGSNSIGPQGLRGYTGNQGSTGPQGTEGPQGYRGQQGLAGTRGFQGSDGLIGFQGLEGFQGTQGPEGFQGPQGYNGIDGTQGPLGFQGFKGPQGYNGIDGTQGPLGFQGMLGFQGPQGSDANEIYTSSYASTSSVPNTVGGIVSGTQVSSLNGNTYSQLFDKLLFPAISPTVTLTSSSTIAFNQNSVSNVLNFSYIIRSVGASVQSAILTYKFGSGGLSNTLDTNVSDVTYTHIYSYGVNQYSNTPLIYTYTVTDTSGGTNTVSKTITPATYAAPSVNLSSYMQASSLTGPQSNTIREYGNVSTMLTSPTINNPNWPNVGLTSYQIQYSLNSGTWTNITGASGFLNASGGDSNYISSYTDSVLSSTANTIQYRLQIIDSYTTNYYTYPVITFYSLYLFGYSTINGALTSAQAYSLGNGLLLSSKARTLTGVSAPSGNWTYIAIPHSYGTISGIIQDGATPVYGAFNSAPNQSNFSIINQYSVDIKYDIYKSNASNAFTNNTLVIS